MTNEDATARTKPGSALILPPSVGGDLLCDPTTDLRLIQQPHIFGARKADRVLPAGGTIAEILAAAGIVPTARESVLLGDRLVPRDAWSTCRPPEGSLLRVVILPEGEGNGRKAIRTIAMIIIMVIAVVVGTLIAGPAGGVTTASAIKGALASAAIMTVGTMILNAVAPMPLPDQGRLTDKQQSASRAINGTANRPNPYGKVPRVYGRHRVWPYYAAQPYTLVEGEYEYLYLLFDLGYGPLKLSEFRIGENPITNFSGVDLEIREGWPDDTPVTLYPGRVDTQDLSKSLTYDEPTRTFRRDQVHRDDDYLQISNHPFQNGAPVEFKSGGNLPQPLTAGTGYYVVGRTANTFQLTTAPGGAVVDLTTQGSDDAHTVVFGRTFLPAAVNTTDNTLTIPGQPYQNGDRVEVRTNGTLPAPLVAGTTYFVRDATTNTVRLALTVGGSAIDLTSQGTGTEHRLCPSVEHVFETADDCDEFVLEFAFQGLVSIDPDGGDKNTRFVDFQVGYRLAGTTDPLTRAGLLPPPGTRIESTEATEISRVTAPLPENPEILRTTVVYRTDHPVAGDRIAFTVDLTDLDPDVQFTPTSSIAVAARAVGETKWTQREYRKPNPGQTSPGTGLWHWHLAIVPPKKGVEIEIQFTMDAYVGSTFSIQAWLYESSGSASPTEFIRFLDARETLIRKGVRVVVPARNRYEIHVRRMTPDSTSFYNLDASTLVAVKTITHEPPVSLTSVVGRHCLVAAKIQASDSMQGVIDQFNCVASSVLPVWDGAAWALKETASPAWIYADVFRGAATKRALAAERIDLARLLDWAGRCTALGHAFNGVFDWKTNVFEAARTVAAIGRASFSVPNGKYSVVEDIAQSVPVWHFTPRNSWNYHGSKAFGTVPHALRMRFKNAEKGWVDDERIVYDDGYDAGNASLFETVDAFGITDTRQAWRRGRYELAVRKLRPEVYTIETDVENLRCTRGDYVLLSHDVMLVGQGAARVKALSGSAGAWTGLTMDEPIIMEAGKEYGLRIRLATGTSVHAKIVTVAGSFATVTFQTPQAAALQSGDLLSFGEFGEETIDCLVQRIEPGADLTAKLTLIDLAPGVHVCEVLPQDFAPAAVNTTTNTIALAANPFADGDEVSASTTDTLPAPLTTRTRYYVVGRTAGSVGLSLTRGGAAIDLTTQGVGTHTLIRQVPLYDSHITLPPVLNLPAPAAPVLGEPSTEMGFGADATIHASVLVPFTPVSTPGVPIAGYKAQYRRLGGAVWTNLPPLLGPANEYRIANLELGKSYEVRIQAVGENNLTSVWSTPVAFTVGLGSLDGAALGPALEDFDFTANLNLVTVAPKASFVTPLGFRGLRYRWSADAGQTWTEVNPLIGAQTSTITIIIPVDRFVGATLDVLIQIAVDTVQGGGAWSASQSLTLNAPTDAAAAAAAAAAAQADADAANALLADIASDAKLTAVEKSVVRWQWDIIASEKAPLEQQADSFGITTEKATYQTKFQALADYLNDGATWTSGVPVWIDNAHLGTTTDIVGATFRTKFKDYYDARTALLLAVEAKAKALADTANDLIADMADDAKLTALEKCAVRREWEALASEKPVLDAQATAFGITTEKTTYDTKFQALADYLNGGSTWTSGVPVWINDANLGTTTDIVGATWRTKFKEYFDARTALLNAVTTKAKTLADAANGLIADIASDAKFTAVEKTAVRREWETLAAEKSVLDAQATAFGITTEKTTYDTKFQALADYLNNGVAWVSGVPNWIADANLATTTDIVGATFRTKFKEYYDARTALLLAVEAKAKQLADTANNAIADIANDAKLTAVEKSAVRREWETIAAEKSVLDAQATAFGVTTEKTTYDTKFQALADYLNNGAWTSGVPLWINDANLATTTDIVATTWRTKFREYYDARTALVNALVAKAKQLADTANSAIAEIANDAKLTAVEKSAVRQEWEILAAEKTVLDAQATAFGITTEKTTYDTKFQALADYLNGGTGWTSGVPLWINDANLATTTDIVATTWRTKFREYYDARTALINAITTKAKQLADTANSAIADIANDAKFTAVEKSAVRREWEIIAGEKPVIETQATNFGITTEKTTYTTKFQALADYLNNGAWTSGIPLWINDANLAVTTDIVAATWRTKFKEYYDARTALLNAISTKAKDLADAAQSDATDAQGDAASALLKLSDIASDAKLTPVEKILARRLWENVAAEKDDLDVLATSFGVTTEKTTYDTKFQALADYLNNGVAWVSGIPTWLSDANLAVTTDVVGTTWRTKWNDYFDARIVLVNKISNAWRYTGTAEIDGGKIHADTVTAVQIAAGTITTNELNFTPVVPSNIVATINASSEGLRIASSLIRIDGTVVFSSGYDPTTKIASGGAAADVNAGGTAVQAGKVTYTGGATVDSLKPAEALADVTGTHTANDTNYVSGTSAATIKTNAANGASAWTKFSGAGNTLPAGNVEFNFATSTTKGGNATNTDAVGSQSAATVQAATVNFNSRNDRASAAITAPTVADAAGTVDHTLNTDGSCDVSFEWTWGGAEADIDGFIVYVHDNGTAAPSVRKVLAGTADASVQVFYVTPARRAFILYGVAANHYYTLGVQAYRIVDPDVAASGVIASTIAQPGDAATETTHGAYRPDANVAFAGNVTGTIDGTSATTVKTNAASGAAAWTKFSGAGNTLPAGNVEFNFAASTTKGGNATNTDAVGSQSAATVQAATVNFNSRNDRASAAITAPTVADAVGTLDHTLNTDGSCDLSFEWTWGGAEADIDGFILYVHDNGTAAPSVRKVLASTADPSVQVYYATPARRAFILHGVAANHYYTLGVQAYRIVDPDVAASGVIASTIAQPGDAATETTHGAYRPDANVAFAGNVTGTIDGTSAATVKTNAANAWAKFSGAGNTLPAGNVEFNFAASSTKGGNATNTDAVGTQSAATVQAATVNFNSRNDRASAAITAPTVADAAGTLDHTLNTDGSCDLSFEWTWGGAEADIDGFILYVHDNGTAAPSVRKVLSSTADASVQVYYATPARRAFLLHGVAANHYYTLGVQAYRIVDPDVAASGVIASTIAQPGDLATETTHGAYRPDANVAFAGNVTGTIDGTSAATVKTNAANAWAKFSGAGNTLPAGNVEFNFAASSTKGGNATNTDAVGSQSAATVQAATVNFNSRNDRASAAITAPTVADAVGTVDHTVNTDGSCDLSFEWTWGGAEADIDGFIVYVHDNGTSAPSVRKVLAGTADPSVQVYYVTPSRRAFLTYGVAANHYYTLGVQAYRIVDPDVAASGVIASAIAQPGDAATETTHGAYRPDANVAFAGNLTGTIDGTSATTVKANAASGAAAWAKFSGAGNTLPSGNVEFNFAASSTKGGNATNTDAVGTQSAATVQAATVNFNSRNDRASAAITAPTVADAVGTVDHTVNTDGSCDLSFEWTWGGAEADIDGFIVYVHDNGTSAPAVRKVLAGTADASVQVFYVTPARRAFLFYGVAANHYYTFGVQAYRIVDPDVAASGSITSAIAQPGDAATEMTHGAYRPDANVAFAGNLTGTINGTAASTVTANAANGATAYTQTAEYRSNTAPSNNATFNAWPDADGVPTGDGNIVFTVSYSYTQGATRADNLLLYAREGGGTVTEADPAWVTNPVTGTMKFLLKPSTTYTFGLQAMKVTASGASTTAILTSGAITTAASNYTGNVNGVPASTVSGWNYTGTTKIHGGLIQTDTIEAGSIQAMVLAGTKYIQTTGFTPPSDNNTAPGTGVQISNTTIQAYGGGANDFRVAFGGPLYSSDGNYMTCVGFQLTATGRAKRYPLVSATNFSVDGQTHWYRWIAPASWVALRAYTLGQVVRPTTGDLTRCYMATSATGTSGSVQPTWNTTQQPITDGTVTWCYIGSLATTPIWVEAAALGIADNGEDWCILQLKARTAAPNAYGLWSESVLGDGVHGLSLEGSGVSGASTDGVGVTASSTNGPGLSASSTNGDSIVATSYAGNAVRADLYFPDSGHAFSSNNLRLTGVGGLAVKMKVGEAGILKGHALTMVTTVGSQYNLQVRKVPTAGTVYCVGFALADGGSVGDDLWVVTGGLAYVKPQSNVTPTRGNLVGQSATEAGTCDSNAPGNAQARVWGSWAATGTGAGALTLAVVSLTHRPT